MAKKKMSFEQALSRLEEIVAALEGSQVSLEDSMGLYKEGIDLSVFCAQILQTAEKEVAVLQESAEGIFSQKPLSQ